MSLYKILSKKSKKRKGIKATFEYGFFLSNHSLLLSLNRFKGLYSVKNDFDLFRANIIIQAIFNKKIIEKEIKNISKLSKNGLKKNANYSLIIHELLSDRPYFLIDKAKIFIPFFSKTINAVYAREPEKLLTEPYSLLANNYNDALIDPFDVYGPNLFNSYFTRLVKVDASECETAFFHYDTNKIYIVNNQGRLDNEIVLFDKYMKNPSYNHMIDRIKPVVKMYFDNNREGFINELFNQQLISQKMKFLLKRDWAKRH